MKEQLFTSLRRMTTAGGRALWTATPDSFLEIMSNRAYEENHRLLDFFKEYYNWKYVCWDGFMWRWTPWQSCRAMYIKLFYIGSMDSQPNKHLIVYLSVCRWAELVASHARRWLYFRRATTRAYTHILVSRATSLYITVLLCRAFFLWRRCFLADEHKCTVKLQMEAPGFC